jgi:hypothetical protein
VVILGRRKCISKQMNVDSGFLNALLKDFEIYIHQTGGLLAENRYSSEPKAIQAL